MPMSMGKCLSAGSIEFVSKKSAKVDTESVCVEVAEVCVQPTNRIFCFTQNILLAPILIISQNMEESIFD